MQIPKIAFLSFDGMHQKEDSIEEVKKRKDGADAINISGLLV